jgi:DMSO/TMAO reductase YedYZ heme-binding membrane subunit
MNDWLWYVTRASGIVATVLMLASLAWGLLFSARETGRRLRPAWWLDLHNWLGGLALVFTGVHLLSAFLDSDLGVSLSTVFVPGAAEFSTTAFTWGVVAFYGLAIVVLTSWPKKLFRRKAWRMVHLLSIPATVLACVHAYQLGSDADTPVFPVVLAVLAGAVMYPLGVRLFGVLLRGSRTDSTQVQDSSHLRAAD